MLIQPLTRQSIKQSSEQKEAQKINGESPKIIAEEANKLNIPLVHYSTDYVFDGDKSVPYTEKDEPRPLNVYGKTKLMGERYVQFAHDRHLILRTSWVYSPTRGQNFYRKMIKLFQEVEEVKVVNDQIGSPTSASFIAKKTVEILSQIKKQKRTKSVGGSTTSQKGK